MKQISLTLVCLAMAVSSTTANPTTEMSPTTMEQSSMPPMREIMKDIFKFFQGDPEASLPLRKIGEMVASMVPCMDMRPMCVNSYVRWCGVNNCKENAPKCMNAIMPDDMCMGYKMCLPVAMDSMKTKKGFKQGMTECLMKKIMPTIGAEFDKNASYEDNVRNAITALVDKSDLMGPVKDVMKSAVAENGTCIIPAQDSCMTESMMLKKCLMDVCVLSLSTTNLPPIIN